VAGRLRHLQGAAEPALRPQPGDTIPETGDTFPENPDSGHARTISLMVRMRRTSWNVMKPRIQCVLTQWIPSFMPSGRGPIVMITLGETALSWDDMSAASMQQAWFPGWCHSG
jgi:hypothetical protein